ncbi:protein SCO1 homolog 2, mitochondrial-like [Vicia villosa]|uniref:protein SCO1 homolog 2, mitochondrial-like n=1 Tax=Vicia villosa TaxID=3911 RepID=UPI00273C70E6|nr:protein SCO1 homolog 2, mitochondrial-like [Vicia villosa]XP_058758855.1 protein SCO1 homolog 2, mitochondrial-like [Vicia villosa]
MTVSRFLHFSSKHRSTREALALLLPRRVPSNKTQSVRYSNSTKRDKPRHDLHPVFPSQSEGSRSSSSWGAKTVAAVALGFAGIAAFFHYNDERRVVPKGDQRDSCSRNIVSGPIIGGPFTLVNKEKQTVTERNFLGNWILLYFGYTSSPDIGPEQVHLMAKAIDTLESKQNLKILPVFVTIDPQRDTPSQLRAYLEEFSSRIVGLTGTVAAIRKMAQEYRVYFKKVEEDGTDYLVDSSHNMYLLNPDMEVVRCFGVEYNAEQLSEAIWKELNKTPL